ncbi:MAG TPA: hypothetical protein VLG49_00865 [Rhabdochlamydiaceae bacterium]|nr:hypothetical protein [Rhabdochlamydiaceae bacterium]
MPLPVNFSGNPGEEPHHFFRKVCIDFKKKIRSSKDSVELKEALERFVDSSKQLDWHHKSSGVYRKNEGDKAIHKVWTECTRYIDGLASNSNPQDLLDALEAVDHLVDSLKSL